jgi:hypothetical protein
LLPLLGVPPVPVLVSGGVVGVVGVVPAPPPPGMAVDVVGVVVVGVVCVGVVWIVLDLAPLELEPPHPATSRARGSATARIVIFRIRGMIGGAAEG